MDLETTQTTSGDDISSMMASLYSEPAADKPSDATPAEIVTNPESSPALAEQPVTPEEPKPDAAQDELAILKRVVATTPELREAYTREKYGLPPVQQRPQQQPQYQQPVQQPQPAAPQPVQLPFDENSYDPTNLQHQIALNGYLLQQQLSPFAHFIQQQQQENQMAVQQQQQQYVQTLETGIRDMVDKELPGYKDLYNSPKLSVQQKALVTEAHDLFQKALFELHPDHHINPKVHQQIIRDIAPQVKNIAQQLGINFGSKPQQTVNHQMARETYVESSSAVPTKGSNPFQKAYDKGDIGGMINSISKMK